MSGNRTSFILSSAENYELPSEVDRCYFFNPFSVEILHSVLARIYESYYENPREILLFFLLSIGGIYQLSDDGGTANVL